MEQSGWYSCRNVTAGFGVLTREDSSDDKETEAFYLGLTRKDDIGNVHIRGA